jgi:ketosteroid isomerase-like protein
MEVASSAERERIARDGLQAYDAGDFERILRLLTEDVEVFASPELANAGGFRGHDGFVKWIEPWTEVWEEIDVEVQQTEAIGERHIVAAVHQTGRGRSDIEVSMDVAFLFDVDDQGQVPFLALLPDRQQAIAMAREREASA